ncbi:phenylalanine--tRNA ligase subunit beta [Peptostreptococcus equinus]|uniref:Phenylalanine--tRNA ligase beta subunit n=1 Tax=Peptostreptococcus equinus TaxID=3003601 RepID=A0ABY7JTM8_9FIRM|nr:phenylalanine--tRNA ligase subunit beta [Peptostreptococcus sp. CBA3647]WAW15503.1 phenylalanine--tRNA ligase subunit beta [Peptostreptococcus sp. CBA3647]
MLVSLKWLRDYVDIDVDPKTFGDKMTMTGTKTETIENLGDEISGVVVAKIVDIQPHPDAEKLVVTQVDIGKKENIQIVTGAKNIKVGDIIPLATHGSNLPGGIKIKKSKLRGIESNGMMCSAKELGIDEKFVEDYKKNGIFILDMEDSYKLGKDIKDVLGLDDAIIDFELTSNRPDCKSMIGIAREAAVTLDNKLKFPNIIVKEESDKDMNISVEIKDNDLCTRYLARKVTDIKIERSPYWMQRRLIESGIRPINNIVDITNFVMIEMGQPMHAFDMRQINGDKIVVKTPDKEEIFTTLDGQERQIDEDTLMICDADKNLGLAGIMGGLDSEVKEDTKEILFESAVFNKENIRKSSKRLGLRTEASSRFEKGVSEENAKLAIERAAQLVELLGAGKVVKGLVDTYPNPKQVQKLTIDPIRINKRIGIDIPMDKFCSILESLEFKCNLKTSNELELEVPYFRLDIVEEADIFEEIARIYGFENIPSVQLQGNSTAGVKTDKQKYVDNIKNTAIACGLYETITYSFVSPKGLDRVKIPEDSKLRDVVKLINPLGEDTSIMRSTMLANMMDVLSTNNSHNVEKANIFECGHIFTPDDMAGVEETRLCLGMYGDNVDFYTLKGVLEKIFQRNGIKNPKFVAQKENTSYHPGRCADVFVDGRHIATLGEAHPQVCDNYNISKRVYLSEVNVDIMFELSDLSIVFSQLPKYPSITRDIALLLDEKIQVGQIEEVIMEKANELVEACNLFDVYKGAQIEEGKKSVAYSIVYRSLEKTLTDDDIAQVHSSILKALEEKLDAKLRD